MKRGLMSLVLCLCMCLSLLPMGAFAAYSEGVTVTDGNVTVSNEADLREAFADTTVNTITLGDNFTVNSGFSIDRSVTLDMAGKTISYLAAGMNKNTYEDLFAVKNGGDLTVTGNGTINGPENGQGFDGKCLFTVDGTNASLTIVNGTINATGSGSDGMYGVYVLDGGTAILGDEASGNGPTIHSFFAAVGLNHMTAPATVTIYGGNYSAAAAPTDTDWWSYFCGAIYAASSGTINISDGTFSGYYGISTRYSDVDQDINITGGTFNSTKADVFYDGVNGSNDPSIEHVVNISGGSFGNPIALGDKSSKETADIEITGGTFTSPVDDAYLAEGYADLQVSGGKYIVGETAAVDGTGAATAIVIDNGDGTYTAYDSTSSRTFTKAEIKQNFPYIKEDADADTYRAVVKAVANEAKAKNVSLATISTYGFEVVVTEAKDQEASVIPGAYYVSPYLIISSAGVATSAKVLVPNAWLNGTEIPFTLAVPDTWDCNYVHVTHVPGVHDVAPEFIGGVGTGPLVPAPPAEPTEEDLGWFPVEGDEVDLALSNFSYVAMTPGYQVTFHSNFGDPEVTAVQYFAAGESEVLDPGSEFSLTREGYTFTGWSTNKNGGGTTYSDSESVILSENTTLYAQWSRNGGGGGSSAVNQIHVPASVDNGTVTVTPKSAAQGRTVTVTPKPDQGYETAGVTVTDARGNNIPVTKNDDGTYTFTMPASAVTVTPTFTKAQETPADDGSCKKDAACPISKFTDASPTAWYHDGVHWALDKEIMKGTGDTTFAPNGNTTRAMVVTMLWRLEGEPQGTASAFTDVPADAWYAQAVNWAAETGVVKGISKTTFAPNANVTREQLATILYRYAQTKGQDVSVGEDTNILSYKDATTISDWAMSAMQWACGGGIITGMGDGTLAPGHNATRAQIATMFMRFCEAAEK